jgi:hypothetical protein
MTIEFVDYLVAGLVVAVLVKTDSKMTMSATA